MVKQVEFNKEQYKALEKRYIEALKNKEEQFVFEGNEYLTSYAKYLLQYLETMFKK